MRTRINAYALCSHATPDGGARMGRTEVLRKKFQKGEITEKELREYVEHTTPASRNSKVQVICLGITKWVTREVYNSQYVPIGYPKL